MMINNISKINVIMGYLCSTIFQVCGYGEAKTSSCRLKYGCVVETLFGCLVPELPMFIVDIPVHLATPEVLQINSKDSQQL